MFIEIGFLPLLFAHSCERTSYHALAFYDRLCLPLELLTVPYSIFVRSSFAQPLTVPFCQLLRHSNAARSCGAVAL